MLGAVTLAWPNQGPDLYLLDIDDAGLSAVIHEAAQFGTEVIGANCDLARPEQISPAVKALLQRWDRLDILVNNAGVSYHGTTDRMPAPRSETVLGVHLLAPIPP